MTGLKLFKSATIRWKQRKAAVWKKIKCVGGLEGGAEEAGEETRQRENLISSESVGYKDGRRDH